MSNGLRMANTHKNVIQLYLLVKMLSFVSFQFQVALLLKNKNEPLVFKQFPNLSRSGADRILHVMSSF